MMVSGIFRYTLTGLFLYLLACQDVVVVVEKIPENTPEEASIHITGNFNYWDPGDANFLLTKNQAGTHLIKMPMGKAKTDFKFTRGAWNTVETDICGDLLDNRHFEYGTQAFLIY